MRSLVVTLLLLGLAVGGANAQAPDFQQSLQAAATLRLAALQAAPEIAVTPPGVADLAAPRGSRRERSLGTTLMIAGGAAILVGAIAGGGGGTALIIGGMVCAGYGLYIYQP